MKDLSSSSTRDQRVGFNVAAYQAFSTETFLSQIPRHSQRLCISTVSFYDLEIIANLLERIRSLSCLLVMADLNGAWETPVLPPSSRSLDRPMPFYWYLMTYSSHLGGNSSTNESFSSLCSFLVVIWSGGQGPRTGKSRSLP